MTEYYLVSVKHTRKNDPYITFWGPDDADYKWPLAWAGKYTEKQIRANPFYYNNRDSTFPVPVEIVKEMAIPKPAPKMVDGDTGPVVQNNKENMRRLLSNRMMP